MSNHPEGYEKAHAKAFNAIMGYNHPSISGLDAEFLADEVLHELGKCRRKACWVRPQKEEQ